MAPPTRSRLRASPTAAGGADEPLLPSGAASGDASPLAGAAVTASSSASHLAPSLSGRRPSTNGSAGHLAGPGGSLDDLCRLQYDADGEPAAAHDHVHVHAHRRRADQPTLREEAGGLLLLVLLYMVQGVPLGLTTGALPFMLSSKLSYTQMGIFALASYPYSLKLLWSPIVDALYSRRLGRRKSWIVPIQAVTAYLLIAAADRIQDLYEQADVVALTWIFLVFVFLMATQDVAVDGWALTLLSPGNVSYASTCQTIGTTTGIFTSFTIFLALQDANFCNRFLRGNSYLAGLIDPTPSDAGLVTLSGYMRFWGWAFAAVTALVALFVREAPDDDRHGEAAATAPLSAEERDILGMSPAKAPAPASHQGSGTNTGNKDAGANGADAAVSGDLADKQALSGGSGGSREGVVSELATAYLGLWRVVRLPAVWRLTALLLTFRLGILAAEGAASLKLMDKGVAKEALAFLVLFQFPVELLSAVVAGRWAASHSPYWPFMTGYGLRLATAAATVALTAAFPPGATSLAEHSAAFGALAAVSLATSFVSYLSFTAICAFFNTISDPAMGGAYLTLLNTIMNMGFMLPRTPLFWLMDVLTVPRCVAADASAGPTAAAAVLPHACPKKLRDMARGEHACAAAGGVCELAWDGYYIVSCVSLVVGLALAFIYPRFVRGLMREPLSSWRARPAGGEEGAEGQWGGDTAGTDKKRD